MKRPCSSILLLACVLATPAAYVFASGPPPTPDPPADVTNTGTIAPAGEPGQRLRISGRVFAPDGTTPVAGVFVYGYQTGADGLYRNDPTTRVARLHGWAKTDDRGRFEFVTIHPGAYPNRQVAAHVHFHVWGAGYPLQWTNDLLFQGDPLLKPETVNEARAAGNFGNVCAVSRDPAGTELCRIDFRLLKQTNYPAQDRDDPRTR